jgi:hypothetical protein|tara:strand:+ start:981 stop:1133 length:153 start_codon:yes stop_codon:yes gene_type:complete
MTELCLDCEKKEATRAPEWNFETGEHWNAVTDPKFCNDCFHRIRKWFRGY